MSSLYSIIPINDNFLQTAQKWLSEQGIVITGTLPPTRNPTLGELIEAVVRLPGYRRHSYEGGMIFAEVFIEGHEDDQVIYLYPPPYPIDPQETVKFYLKGYSPIIVPSLVNTLSRTCGRMLVLRSADASILFVSP